MKRYSAIAYLLVFFFCASFCMSASAQASRLGKNMEVSDQKAWNEFSAKMHAIHRERPVVALVLGGGGAKGAAHIGVLKYLEEINMPVDMVLGTSMGGLMGSLFALGYTADQIDTLVSHIDWPTMMSDKISDDFLTYKERKYKEKYVLQIPFEIDSLHFKRSMPAAYIQGQNVRNLINSLIVGYTDDMHFCNLPIPFACVSTDLVGGKGIVWTGGSLGDALRSTMSVPLVFAPVRKDGRFLVDGGMVDNFPADVAKALGADIIIGVNVGSPSVKYEDAYNVMDVVSLAIDLNSKTRLEETLQIPDLLLNPDLEGLNMLSFSDDNVRKLITNGYKCACDSSAIFSDLRKRVGERYGLVRHASPAKSLSQENVRISGLVVNGVSDRERDVLMESIDLDGLDSINKRILDENVSRLYGSRSFKNVTYSLVGKEPYELQLDCVKGPSHRFGLGVRFDTEEVVSAMINVGLFEHSLYGSRFDLDLKLSANPYIRGEFSYNLPRCPRFCVAVDAHYFNTSLMSFSLSPFKFNAFMSHQDIYMSDFNWNKYELVIGIRNTVAKTVNSTIASPVVGQRTDYAGAFINIRMDGMAGGQYFPTSGTQFNFDYTWRANLSDKASVTDFAHNNYHAASIGVRTAATPSDYFTYIFSADARMVYTLLGENLPIYERNIIGGDVAGRYVDHQLDFAALNNAYCVDNSMAIIRNDFRFKIAKKQYITARGMISLFNDLPWAEYETSSVGAFFDRHSVYGAVLEYAVNTVVGPVKANVHWSNALMDTKYHGVGVYVSIGFNF